MSYLNHKWVHKSPGIAFTIEISRLEPDSFQPMLLTKGLYHVILHSFPLQPTLFALNKKHVHPICQSCPLRPPGYIPPKTFSTRDSTCPHFSSSSSTSSSSSHSCTGTLERLLPHPSHTYRRTHPFISGDCNVYTPVPLTPAAVWGCR